MENITPDQWKVIVNKKLRFPPELIAAIHEGNVGLVSKLLSTGDGIIRQLDDSEDRLWREALNLSIRLGKENMMTTLFLGVKFDFRQIHEALLVAVDTNQPRVVKLLLDRLDQEKGNKMDVRSFSTAIFDSSIDDSQFAPGVTPLTLACQKDLYDIVAMLTQRGHDIPLPHSISCICLECRNARQYDLLKFSLSRINTYRGIASRAYLSVTAEDSMLTAFHLSRELRRLSKKEPEFKPQYLNLEELCQEFAVELLAMCRNQSEVTTILNNCESDSDDDEDDRTFDEGIPNLSRLRLAVNFNQKQFVTHPICQQVLSSIWCGNLSWWRGSKTAWKLLVSLGIFLTMPFLCLVYWLAPKSKLGKNMKIPVIKFLLHSASYMWFLITLLGESIFMEIYRDDFASRNQNFLHNSLHMVWVVGFFWFECKEVWIEGLRSYFLDFWNILDMMVLSMYLASFALRVVIMLRGYIVCQDSNAVEECVYFTDSVRQDWRQEDPQFLSEILFAVTSMLSFTRLAYILPAHESLGTLQISIGKMIDDMMRFMFLLMIIGTAFLCGLNNIYVPYVICPHLGKFNETINFLFWTMFGVANQDYVDMPAYVLAEFMGRILYGVFTLVIVIVLLNMLIAMITNSFQKIEDDADVEWKFARSKLYLSYFREGLTMPVPFNIIPSPKALFYAVRGTFRMLCCCCRVKSDPEYPPIASMSNSTLNNSGGQEESRLPYRVQVMKALVQRYIETARREFEETKRKDVGNRITELSMVVGKVHAEMKNLHQTLASGLESQGITTTANEGSNILSKYIMGAKNNFRGFDNKAAWQSGSSPLEVAVHIEDEQAQQEKKDEETRQEKKDEETKEGKKDEGIKEGKKDEGIKEEKKGEGSKDGTKDEGMKDGMKGEGSKDGKKDEGIKEEKKDEGTKEEKMEEEDKQNNKGEGSKEETKPEWTMKEKIGEGKEGKMERKREIGGIASADDKRLESVSPGSLNSSKDIMGANNNFRGFDNKAAWQSGSSPLEVAVHIEDEQEKKDEETRQEKKDEETKEGKKDEGTIEGKKEEETKEGKKGEGSKDGKKDEGMTERKKYEGIKEEKKEEEEKQKNKGEGSKEETKSDWTMKEKIGEGKEGKVERKRENGGITWADDKRLKTVSPGSLNSNFASTSTQEVSTQRKTESRTANGTSETKISNK